MPDLEGILPALEPDRRSHPFLNPQELDAEIALLPAPPTDLPKPWKGSYWRAGAIIGLIVTAFAFWPIVQTFKISYVEMLCFPWLFSCTLWAMFLGPMLWIVFGSRAYFKYAWPRGIWGKFLKYLRPERNEVLFAQYHKLVIDGQKYFLMFYVPSGGAACRELKPGSEVLLFNEHGRWLDNEKIFHKAMLMWTQGRYISPSAIIDNSIIRAHNGVKKLVIRYLPLLPRLLDLNAARFARHGLQAELDWVRQIYPAKAAYCRRLIDMGAKKIAWGEAHGWDSALELRYPHMLALHEAAVRLDESIRQFAEKHHLQEAQKAATIMFKIVEDKESKSWEKRSKLIGGLQILAVPVLDKSEASMFRYENDEWRAPDNLVQAYRQRRAYAYEVDTRPITQEERRAERVKAIARRIGVWLLALAGLSFLLFMISLFIPALNWLAGFPMIFFIITGILSGNIFIYTKPNYQIAE